MRLGTWNNRDYAGYPAHPEKQLDWFLDQAQAVGAQRRARGLAVDDPKQYGNWIADIERPAAQYRGRYQLNYQKAHALVQQAQARSHKGAVNVLDVAPGGAAHAGPRAVAALAEARRYIGTPYKWGGSSPSTGFDCSGLVQWAYAKAGIRIPRVTDQQILAANGSPISRKNLLPGDLVFFRDSSGYVHHVGISLGGDKFVNAPHTGADVRINSLSEPYFAQEFAGGRRFDHAVAADHPHAVAARAPVDDQAVRIARAALLRDAAEAQRPGTLINAALERQERGKDQVQFLPAVKRSQLG
jgi:cell wall-associated NlpC family hydrolase